MYTSKTIKNKIVRVALVSFLLALTIVTLFSCRTRIPRAILKNEIDSISYAQGVMYASQVEHILTQLNLEKSNKTYFIQGFMEGFQINPKNRKKNALMIGKIIGYQMSTQFIPYFNSQFFGKSSTKTINKNNFMEGYISTIKNDGSALFDKKAAQVYAINKMEALRKSLVEKTYSNAKKNNIIFLEKNKSNKGVVVLPSGLQYKIITRGKGEKPNIKDIVKVHYRGTNIKGEVFDSSYKRNKPAEISLKNVIHGWAEGLQLMPVGSKYVFYIPSELAYGDRAQGPMITPFSTLIFEVKLLEIVKKN